jgi:hypothetical protein
MAERGLYQLVRFAGDEASVVRLTAALAAIVWNTLYDGARPRRRGAQPRRPATRRRARTEVH